MSDTRCVTLDLHAAMRDPGKMNEGWGLANDGLFHGCELVEEVAELLYSQINVWIEALAREPVQRIRNVLWDGSHRVSGGKHSPSLSAEWKDAPTMIRRRELHEEKDR